MKIRRYPGMPKSQRGVPHAYHFNAVVLNQPVDKPARTWRRLAKKAKKLKG